MPKPQLKKIQEHLKFLSGKRNPFTEPDHLDKTSHYITKQFENFNLSVNQEGVQFSNHALFWDTDIPAVMDTDTVFFWNPHYHQSTDTLETLDIELNAETVAETLKTLLKKK